jgi:hypothetical protein
MSLFSPVSDVPFTAGTGIYLWPTQLPVQWEPEVLSLEVKRPGREAGHSHPSSVVVKNVWMFIFIPPYVLIA